MQNANESSPTGGTTNDPRVYLAAERTFLAWIRTGLSLMGFGFVVARFGIFLQQLVLDRGVEPPNSAGVSVILGVSLVTTGVFVCLSSAWLHVRLIRTLQRGELFVIKPSLLAMALAFALAVVGLVMTYFLLHSREETSLLNPKESIIRTAPL